MDKLDFGLITTSLSDQPTDSEYMLNGLGIYEILEYAYHDDVYFRVKTTDVEVDYIAVKTDSPTRKDLVFYNEDAIPESLKKRNYKWRSVAARDCFYGSYYIVRIILLLILVVSLFGVFKIKQRK